jgi:hypothetical protein
MNTTLENTTSAFNVETSEKKNKSIMDLSQLGRKIMTMVYNNILPITYKKTLKFSSKFFRNSKKSQTTTNSQ